MEIKFSTSSNPFCLEKRDGFVDSIGKSRSARHKAHSGGEGEAYGLTSSTEREERSDWKSDCFVKDRRMDREQREEEDVR